MMNSTRFKNKHFFLWGLIFLPLLISGFAVQAATLTVSTSTLNVGHNQHTATFDITSDVSWSVSSSLTWINSFSSTSGSDNETIAINIDPNTTLSSRTGTITISSSGVPSQTITITQSGVTADGYESNDSEDAAYNANFAFNNDVAVIILDSASFHSDADVDYYKVSLPAGYSYKISSELEDSWNSFDYSVNADYSYKVGSSWSSSASSQLSDFTYTGGGDIYFKAVPTWPGDYGAYNLKIIITRGASTSALAVSSNNIPVNAAAGTTSFTVTSNTTWSVSKSGSWFSVSTTGGANNGTVSITTEANTNLYSRTATIMVSANGVLDQEITLTQAGVDLPADSYEPNETEATAKVLTATFTNNMASIITTGAVISTSSDVDYYKITLPTGSSYAISAFLHDVSENNHLLDAEVLYKVGSAGTWSDDFDIKTDDFTFDGGDIYFKVQPYYYSRKGAYSLEVAINRNATGVTPTLSVSTATLSLAAIDNSTNTFTITSNSGWKVASDKPWVSVSPASGWGSGTITVTGMANVESSSRSANLIVSCIAATSKTIAVTQASGGSPSADSYEANETETAASTLTATFVNDVATIVTTGANIHSSTDVDYYKVQLLAGYTYMVSSRLHTNYSYNYENDEYYSLNAKYSLKERTTGTWGYTSSYSLSDLVIAGGDYIYFKVEPYSSGDMGTYALDLTITRAVGAATLSVSPSSVTLDAAAGSTGSFDITSTGAWTLTSSQSWLTPSATSGTGNATITLTATANGEETERDANIYVSGKGVRTQNVYIIQSRMALGPDIYEANNTEGTAFAANVAFNNNMGRFSTSGANLNTTTDVDYYKVSLAAGYNYTIHSTFNQDVDIVVPYKIGSAGTWSSDNDSNIPEFTANGGTDIYFKVAPYTPGEEGMYDINIFLTRKAVSLTLSETALNLAATASTASFNITSNVNWTVTSSQSWLTVGTASGSNNGSITLNATANPDASSRSATVTVTGAGITKTITVNQATTAAPSLDVSGNALNIAAAANSTTSFDITSNVAWTVTSSETWLKINPASGINNASITLTADANTGLNARTSTVTVSGSGINKIITVTQASDPVLTVSATTLSVNATAASTVAFDITSNTSWTVTKSQDWLTVSSASGSNNATITLTAEANSSASTRSAEITVTGSDITKTITVTQAAADPVLNVSATTLNVNAAAASTVTFDITSNTSWAVTKSQDWLTVSSASGSNNATITLTAEANSSASTRSAEITVTGSGIDKKVTITQAGNNTTGLNTLSLQDVKLYPNPVVDKLTVELADKSLQYQVLIYSEKGEFISSETFNTNNFEVEMSKYSAGAYFVKIISQNGTRTVKILKK